MQDTFWIMRPATSFYDFVAHDRHVFLPNLGSFDDVLAPYRALRDLTKWGGEALFGGLSEVELNLDDSFRPNLIWEAGVHVFSEKLVNALDCGSDTVWHVPVVDYRAMERRLGQRYDLALVLSCREAVDLERSSVKLLEIPDRPRKLDAIGESFPTIPKVVVQSMETLVTNEQLDVEVGLFRDSITGSLCVSERLAKQVVEAGISDVQFESMSFVAGEPRKLRHE